MSESKHTPGPWAVTGISQDTGNISVGSKALRIVIADVTNAASFGDMLSGAMRRGGGGFSQADCTTQHANARLIAAAPAWQPIATAPKDGRMFEALYDDGTTETDVYWSEQRYCILGAPQGSKGPGCMSSEVGLPVDPTHWRPNP